VSISDSHIHSTGVQNFIHFCPHSQAAMSVGGLLGGLLADHSSWRIAFGAQVPFCLLAVAISFSCMQIHQKPEVRITDTAHRTLSVDVLGTILLALTIIGFLISTYLLPLLMQDRQFFLLWSLTLPATVSSGFLLYRVETRIGKPIIDFSLLKNRETSSLCIINFAAAFTYHALLYFVPFYVVVVDGSTSAKAGLHLLPMAAAASVGSLFVGWLLAKYRRYRWILIMASLMVVTGPALYSFTTFSTLAPTMYKLLEMISIFPSAFGFQVISSVSLVAMLTQQDEKNLAACTSLATCKQCLPNWRCLLFSL
jgi:predicted MFS family arabinose efflux permease